MLAEDELRHWLLFQARNGAGEGRTRRQAVHHWYALPGPNTMSRAGLIFAFSDEPSVGSELYFSKSHSI